MILRPDLALVAGLIPPGSRVLDLGCGGGELLAELAVAAGCRGTGVEIDSDSVLDAIARGVAVIELDLDRQLDEFATASYDVVVLSRTVQTLHRPAEVLAQMRRIGGQQIVSVPNFGYWRHRLRLLRGRMPMSREIPHAWFDTPNLRHTTLVEIEELFAELGLEVAQRIYLSPKGVPLRSGERAYNLIAGSAVYVLQDS